MQALSIHPLPIPSFSLPKVCLPAGKALFINNTSISDGSGGLLTYLWNFGDKNNPNPSVSKDGPHNYLQLGMYDVTLIATSIDGCRDSITQKLSSVYAQPKASFQSLDSLCLGTAVDFNDKSNSAVGTITGWSWDFGDGLTSIASNPIHVYNSAGVKNIRFYAQASTSCYTDTISKTIMVYEYPKISAGPDLDVLNDGQKKIQSSATGTIVAYKWDSSLHLSNSTILQPYVVKPPSDLEYHLTVTGRGNCISRDTIFIHSVTMPKPSNTFTPNGDGYNDVWDIKYLDQYPTGILEIYTTTGQLILRSIGYPQPWDGKKNGNPLPAGTYYYVIDTRNGKPKMAGYITIIR
jgi:gliding motility-associated-like protein